MATTKTDVILQDIDIVIGMLTTVTIATAVSETTGTQTAISTMETLIITSMDMDTDTETHITTFILIITMDMDSETHTIIFMRIISTDMALHTTTTTTLTTIMGMFTELDMAMDLGTTIPGEMTTIITTTPTMGTMDQ